MNNPYKTAIDDLEIEVAKLLSKVDGLRFAIDTLRSNQLAHPERTPEVQVKRNEQVTIKKSNSSRSRKSATSIVYETLSNLNHFVRISEISKALEGAIEPQQVRNAISALVSDSRVLKVQPTNSNNDTFWGLPEWMNGTSVIGEHSYDMKSLIGTKK